MPPETIFSSDSDFEINQPLAKTTIKSRRNSAEPKYYCTVDGCNQIFRRMDQLDRHEYHHTGVKKHHCLHEGCDKTYSILTHLKRHIRSTHERTEPVPKNVACTVKDCGQMFRSTCNMQRHIREVHENPKVYKCAHCSEQFTQKLKMRRHEITKHTGEFPFNCSKCGKGFYQQYHYDRHLPLCKIYPCPGCELKFEKWSLYRKHCRDTQHGRTYYNCEQCEKIFGKPAELERHMLTVHIDGGDKKLEFKCTADGCQRAYAHERNLKQHVRVAHGGTKFACKEPECTREFSSAQNLRKHVERDHSGVQSEAATAKLHKVVKARLKRKDAGQPAISHLARMSNIAVDKETDKMLRAREVETLKDVSTLLSQVMSTTEDEDDNASTKGGRAKRATPTRN